MSIQFSLFGGEDVIEVYREQDRQAFLDNEKLAREKAEREYERLNPSLVDFLEVETILSQTRCLAPHECNRNVVRKFYEKNIVPEDRVKILRSFATLHLWNAIGGSFEKIELWLKTPKACFQNETPEVFSFHCWHCTTKWMRSVSAKIKLAKKHQTELHLDIIH